MAQKNQINRYFQTGFTCVALIYMGVSNLKVGLSRKFAAWCGERIQLEKQIAKIKADYETLETKQQRVDRLNALTAASIEIMGELDPAWKPEDTKPKRPKEQKIPFESGATTRTAFDIMRELARPTNPAELAPIVIERLGGDPENEDLVNRVKTAIDASLRAHVGDAVQMISKRPTRWEIIGA